MKKHLSLMLTFLFVGALAFTLTQYAFGQPPQGQGNRRFDPEQMRAFMQERMREMLGASEEEWQIIGPRLEKVQTLQMQSRAGGGMMFGRGPGGPGGPGQGPGAGDNGGRGDRQNRRGGGMWGEPMPEATALQELLQSEDAKADDIKAKLQALRAAKARNEAELKKAQAALAEVLTLRQEAQLVLMGTLS